jgi:YD repeat-containing protein
MALTKSDSKSETLTQPSPSPVADSVLLELSLYRFYTWQETTYEGGRAYRFNRDAAMQLLAEQDAGRPIWRLYRPAKPKEKPKNIVYDATEVTAVRTRENIHGTDSNSAPVRRIDVGSDDELSDILSRDGDVTV